MKQHSEFDDADPKGPLPEPPADDDRAAGPGRDDDAADAPIDPLQAMRAVDPEGAAALQAEWGPDFEHNVALARRAASAFADPGLVSVLEESGLGDDPRIVRTAAAIGRMLEGSAADGAGAVSDEAERAALEARLEALSTRDDYWSPETQKKVRKTYLQLYGSAPLPAHRSPGDAGRPV